MRKPATFLVSILLVGCSSTDPNLAKNGSFARNLKHWLVPGWKSSASWTASVDDRVGVLAVTEEMFSAKHGGRTGDIAAARQCIPVAPGVHYDVSGHAFVPSNQTEGGYAVITVVWWKNRRCTVQSVDSGVPSDDTLVIQKVTGKVERAGKWQYVALCGFIAPPEARAAEISLDAVNTSMSLGGRFSAYFDDISFQPHTKECTFLETY